jgi:hypothetical protein
MIEYSKNPHGNIVEIHIEGKITEADLEHVTSRLKEDIQKHGKLRILEKVHNFSGIDPITLWKDARFSFYHVNDFTHAAVVADSQWMRTIAAAIGGILSAEVRAFEASQLDEARAWLSNA